MGDFARGVRKKVVGRVQELVSFCPGGQKLGI